MSRSVDPNDPSDFTLVLRVDADRVPRVIRLRRALKNLYRAYGIRCLRISEVKPDLKPASNDGAGGVSPGD